jgi:hypothetical protein
MERARPTWTDERLDDLARRVDSGFERVDGELRELRTEVSSGFDAVEARLGGRIDSLQRTLIQVGGATIATVLATLATVIVRT